MDQEKGSNKNPKTSKYNAKNKLKNIIKPTYTLHGPGHDMNLCKVIQYQSKCIKVDWLSTHGRGLRGNTAGAKKCLADGKHMNTIIVSYVSKAIKPKKNNKAKAKYDYHL